MFTKRFGSVAVISLGVAAGGTLHAAQAAASAPCVFEKYAPTAVSQYTVEADLDYGSYDVLKGAQLFVPAREGLTRQWLELSIQRALEHPEEVQSKDEACNPPQATKVQVNVTSAGNGFWVQLMTPDPQSAARLVKWASDIVKQHQAEFAAHAHASK